MSKNDLYKIKTIICDRVYNEINKKGLSWGEFAADIGMSKSGIYELINDKKRGVQLSSIITIANYLDISVSELLAE